MYVILILRLGTPVPKRSCRPPTHGTNTTATPAPLHHHGARSRS